MKKKILAIVMTFAMVVGLMPMMAFAEANAHRIEVSKHDLDADNPIDGNGVLKLQNGVTVKASSTDVTDLKFSESGSGEDKHYETKDVTNGQSIKLTFTLPEGRTFKKVELGGTDITSAISSNSYTYTAKNADDSVLTLSITLNDSDSAYLIWKGDNGEICKKLFSNLKQSDNSLVTYIPEASVIDGTNAFNVSEMAQYDDDWYHWVRADKIDEITKHSDWTWEDLDSNLQSLKDAGVIINPCNSKNGQHSVCTFGDRSFKATIYDNDFVGVKFSDKRDDYQYFPDYWDPTFFSSTVDVSGSTIDNPINYTAPFCEDTIKLSAVDPTGSSQADRIVISDIRPLVEQPNEAFAISESAGVWSVHFNSNFYSQVEFEIDVTNNEDSQNPVTNTYYIRINREALKVMDIQAKDFYANFYYAYDDDESGVRTTYEDYDVYTEIVYKDGTRSLEKVDAAKTIINDQGETIGTNYAVSGGKNLNMSQYKIPILTNKLVDRIVFTVTKAGATSIESDTFVGGYMGVGAGLVYDYESRTIIY